ncbi:MAG: Coenzyme F420 hydrogenase/dehydrogenase, beta subunit C-terminal domain [Ruthenibacterium sp.]
MSDYLQKGKSVLFCGTPCHNAALKNFLHREYTQLIQCDFICRGVNSPLVFRKYLDMLEKEYGGTVKSVQFKNKDNGWHCFGTKIEFTNGNTYYKDRYHDLFMVGYLEHNLFVRPSCHHCHFKGESRFSDITLGDFWGIENVCKEMDQDKGTSVIMVSTGKGKALLEKACVGLQNKEMDITQAGSGNLCLGNAIEIGKKREAFFKEIDLPFEVLMKKYAKKQHQIKGILVGLAHKTGLTPYLKRLWRKQHESIGNKR